VRNRASLFLSIALMAVSGAAVYIALDWPLKARLFPLVVAIPVFCLSAVEVAWALMKPEPSGGEMEFQLSEHGTAQNTVRRTLIAVAWMAGFFLAIVLIGFLPAIALLMLAYLRLQGREGWALSVVYALSVWAVVYGVFDWLLHLPFPAGLLLEWLGIG
jgi:hypothetical protein